VHNQPETAAHHSMISSMGKRCDVCSPMESVLTVLGVLFACKPFLAAALLEIQQEWLQRAQELQWTWIAEPTDFVKKFQSPCRHLAP
jgi:hypothetical protein